MTVSFLSEFSALYRLADVTASRGNLLLDMALPLPPPGPDHYAARRARWLAPPDTPPPPRHAHPSIARLERVLDTPDPHTDLVWSRGIDQVWAGLAKGNRLRYSLPMSLVIKVIHVAWRRDQTWPEGAVAPDSDESRAVTSTKPP